jgi:hypothetical protein
MRKTLWLHGTATALNKHWVVGFCSHRLGVMRTRSELRWRSLFNLSARETLKEEPYRALEIEGSVELPNVCACPMERMTFL